jgi:two-component system, cell cycle sensor histidine kinase and response regulator CckA
MTPFHAVAPQLTADQLLSAIDVPALAHFPDVSASVYVNERARRWLKLKSCGPFEMTELPAVLRKALADVERAGPEACASSRRLAVTELRAADGSRARLHRLVHRGAGVAGGRPARLAAQLRQAQKMDALGRLASGIAHDFRNVLTALRGYAELLKADFGDQHPESQQDLEEILRAVGRGEELTHQLLTFSKRRDVEVRPTQIDEVVGSTMSMLRRLIPASVQLDSHLAGTLPPVLGDAGLLEQTLVNLVMNARDAVGNGGRIEIRTSLLTASSPLLGTTGLDVPPGRYAMLIVSDDGPGIPQAIQERIFEPFFTTKSESGGTGIGLAVVYASVHQMGGRISVYSEPGKGASFRVLLPVATESAGTGEVIDEAPAPGPVSESAATLLLVDDDAAVRSTTARVLRRAGYAVHEAESAEAALSHPALQSEAEPARDVRLLITDLVLPGMDGHALAREVHDRYGLPSIVTSGFPEADDPEAGAVFLPKPFTTNGLLRAVRELLH